MRQVATCNRRLIAEGSVVARLIICAWKTPWFALTAEFWAGPLHSRSWNSGLRTLIREIFRRHPIRHAAAINSVCRDKPSAYLFVKD